MERPVLIYRGKSVTAPTIKKRNEVVSKFLGYITPNMDEVQRFIERDEAFVFSLDQKDRPKGNLHINLYGCIDDDLDEQYGFISYDPNPEGEAVFMLIERNTFPVFVACLGSELYYSYYTSKSGGSKWGMDGFDENVAERVKIESLKEKRDSDTSEWKGEEVRFDGEKDLTPLEKKLGITLDED